MRAVWTFVNRKMKMPPDAKYVKLSCMVRSARRSIRDMHCYREISAVTQCDIGICDDDVASVVDTRRIYARRWFYHHKARRGNASFCFGTRVYGVIYAVWVASRARLSVSSDLSAPRRRPRRAGTACPRFEIGRRCSPLPLGRRSAAAAPPPFCTVQF